MNKSSIVIPSGELIVQAAEENNLPSLTNTSNKRLTLKIQAEGMWSYGGEDAFANQVDANGNVAETGRHPYMRFPDITPAALVAVKNNQAVASGKDQMISLDPGESVFFVNNDQPGVYGDNSGSLTIKWSIAAINLSNGNTLSQQGGEINSDIELPSGELIVEATEEQDLPTLMNESDKTITLKIEAQGLWNYGDTSIYAKEVDANGNWESSGQEPKMRFSNIKPAALVTIKYDQAIGSGKEQTIQLKPGEVVSFINNDETGYYFDNSGTQTVKWSIVSAY
jgi:plastocyanin